MDAKLKSKIEKLLALQESPNEHEATVAAEKLSDLLTRYNLDLAEVVDESEEQAERAYVYPAERVPAWKFALFSAIAEVNYCQCVQITGSRANGLYFYGRPTNVTSANLLCDYLVQAVERLTKRYAKGEGRTFANNFRVGCAKRISFRLRTAHQQKLKNGIPGTSDAPHVSAIVCVSIEQRCRQEIEDLMSEFKAQNRIKDGKPRSVSASGPGVLEGAIAGDTVSLSPQVKSGSQLKALGGA